MGKNLRGYLAFAIVGGFVAYTIFGRSGIDVDVQAYQMQINMLEQKIDSIKTENTLLVKEADSLESKITQYDIKIGKLNSEIDAIKEETQQRIDSVDFFGDDELEKFFADRYRQYFNTVK